MDPLADLALVQEQIHERLMDLTPTDSTEPRSVEGGPGNDRLGPGGKLQAGSAALLRAGPASCRRHCLRWTREKHQVELLERFQRVRLVCKAVLGWQRDRSCCHARFVRIVAFTSAEELGFEPKTVVFRWHLTRMAFTSQAMKTPRVKRKTRFNHIIPMLRSHGQCCPQFAPIFGGGHVSRRSRPLISLAGFREEAGFRPMNLRLRPRSITRMLGAPGRAAALGVRLRVQVE